MRTIARIRFEGPDGDTLRDELLALLEREGYPTSSDPVRGVTVRPRKEPKE